MRIDDKVIDKLAQLSMLDIKDEERAGIKIELSELIERFGMVQDLNLKEDAEIREEGDTSHKVRENRSVDIHDINQNIRDGYVTIKRTVGE